MTPASILVTGATGFLGTAFLRQLRAQGRPVRVFARSGARGIECGAPLDVVTGDLADPAAVDRAVAGIEQVYHLGATTRGAREDIQCGTTIGTRNVVAACLRYGVNRLVHVSSLSVLNWAALTPEEPVDERSPIERHPERRGAYTEAKVAAEHIVMSAVRDRDLRAVVLRPGQIVGPGAETVVPNATVAVGPFWITIGPATQRLPLVYLDDVVDGLLLAGSRPGVEGRIFHLVDPEPITQAEYLARCRQVTARRVIRLSGPLLGMVRLAAGAFDLLSGDSQGRRHYRLRSPRQPLIFDIAEAASGLGWTPAVGIRQGLTRTFAPACSANRTG